MLPNDILMEIVHPIVLSRTCKQFRELLSFRLSEYHKKMNSPVKRIELMEYIRYYKGKIFVSHFYQSWVEVRENIELYSVDNDILTVVYTMNSCRNDSFYYNSIYINNKPPCEIISSEILKVDPYTHIQILIERGIDERHARIFVRKLFQKTVNKYKNRSLLYGYLYSIASLTEELNIEFNYEFGSCYEESPELIKKLMSYINI